MRWWLTPVTHDQRDQGAGTFERRAAVLRHELTNPLSVIRGALGILANDERPGQQRDVVEVARRQLELVELLVNGVGVGDDLTVELHPTDLGEVAATTVADLTHTLLAQHPCEVTLPDTPVVVPADAPRIRQLLIVLLDNAAKYSPPGKHIEVEVSGTAEGATLAVTDQGHGIAPEDLEHIFDRYARGDVDVDGLGLGLYVARTIAQAHDGRLVAESAPQGPGTRFFLELPKDPAHR